MNVRIEENPIINISHNERSFYIFSSPLHSAFADQCRYHPRAFTLRPSFPNLPFQRTEWHGVHPGQKRIFKRIGAAKAGKRAGGRLFFTKLTRFKASDGSLVTTVSNVVFSRGEEVTTVSVTLLILINVFERLNETRYLPRLLLHLFSVSSSRKRIGPIGWRKERKEEREKKIRGWKKSLVSHEEENSIGIHETGITKSGRYRWI